MHDSGRGWGPSRLGHHDRAMLHNSFGQSIRRHIKRLPNRSKRAFVTFVGLAASIGALLILTHLLLVGSPSRNEVASLDLLMARGADEREIWARGPAKTDDSGSGSSSNSTSSLLRAALAADTVAELRSLCGRCLYRTLSSYVEVHDHGQFTFVSTGDIAAEWLRDSAVQMATYMPRVGQRPALRRVIEGAIRAQANFILQVRSCCASFKWRVRSPRSHHRFRGSTHPFLVPTIDPRTPTPTRIIARTSSPSHSPSPTASSAVADGFSPATLSWTVSPTFSTSCGISAKPPRFGLRTPC